MSPTKSISIVKQTVSDFMEDRAMRLAAALSYYSIFSMGPLLLLLVGIAGIFFGQDNARQQIHQQMQSTMSPQSAQMVESMMTARQSGGSLIATVIGAVGVILGAAGVFGQLQDALNTIWEVQPKPGRGVWGIIRDRLMSFVMVLGIGLLLLVSMAASSVLTAMPEVVGRFVPIPPVLMQVIQFAVTLGLMTLFFAAIFKVLPEVRVRWRDVWVGALVTALLFAVGQFLLSFYLGRKSTASPFGAAGSIVLVLLWVYYSSLILFFGAEFTKVYARRKGGVEPTRNAVPVTEEARAHQGMVSRERLEHPELIPAPQGRAGMPVATTSGHGAGEHPGLGARDESAADRELAHASTTSHPGVAISPGAVLRRHRWQFLGMAVGTAVAARYVRKSPLYRGYRSFRKVQGLTSHHN